MDQHHDVNILLSSTIERDGSAEETKLYIQGQFYIKNDAFYLKYKENVEDFGIIDHTIRIKQNEGLILRKGAIDMRQPLAVGDSREGTYKSPFGAMQTLVDTECLDVQWMEEQGEGIINMRYDLYMQGESFGRVTLIFQIKESK
ncbi:MAG: DUF1934 domain-containing protein [Tuberibacillus sp.]